MLLVSASYQISVAKFYNNVLKVRIIPTRDGGICSYFCSVFYFCFLRVNFVLMLESGNDKQRLFLIFFAVFPPPCLVTHSYHIMMIM